MAREYGMSDVYTDVLIDDAELVRSKKRKLGIKGVFRILAFAGGAAFGAMLMSVIVLSLTGVVAPSGWSDAISILNQRAIAIDVKHKQELDTAKTERDEFLNRPTEVELVKAWRNLKDERAEFEKRLRLEREALRAMASEIRVSIKLLELRTNDFNKKQLAAKIQKREDAESIQRIANDKIRRIYRAMSPKAVAEDLEKRMSMGRTDEVAAIVAAMNDRSVAEVLENFSDSALRLKIYDAMIQKDSGAKE